MPKETLPNQLQKSDPLRHSSSEASQPIVLPKGELFAKFRILTPAEVEKLGLTKKNFIPLETAKMFYTYVIQSKKDKRLYTGATDDLRKRFNLHNRNQVISTKGRGPFELIYYEACSNQNDAFRREKYLKSGPGKRYLKNRLKRFLSLTG